MLSRFPLVKNWEESLLNEILDVEVPTFSAQKKLMEWNLLPVC